MIKERYNPLFNNKAKSFRLLKTKKNDNYVPMSGIIPKQTDKVIYFPLCTSVTGITDFIFSLYGYNGYPKYVKQYYFPKKIIYKPKLIPGPQRIITTDVAAKKAYVKENFTKMLQEPGFKLVTYKNTIVDYTKAIDLLLFKDKKAVSRENVRKYLLNIFPEILTYFVLGNSGLDTEGIKHASSVNILANSATRDFLNNGFNKVVIGYKIKSKIPIAFSMQYLTGMSELPRNLLLDLDTAYDFSLIRFLTRTYTLDRDNEIDSYYNEWMEYLRNNDVTFYFYNENYAFFVDLKEIKSLGWTDSRFLQSIRNTVVRLVKNNVGEVSNDELDKELEARDAAELENSDIEITDTTEDKTKIDTKQKVITPEYPDYTKEQDKKITQILQNIVLMNKNKVKSGIKEEVKERNEFADEYDSLVSNPEEDKKYEKMLEQQKLKEKTNEIEDDSDINIVGNDEDEEGTYEDIEATDEEIEQAEDEAGLDSEQLDEVVDENDMENEVEELEQMEDKSTMELENTDKTDKDEEDEISEEDKAIILESIEKETKPKKTPKEIARIKVIREKYKSIKLEDNRTIEQIIEDSQANIIDRKVKDVPHLKDESLKYNNVLDLEKSYVKKTMRKDIIRTLKSFSEGDKTINLHMLDVKVNDTSDAFNDKETYVIKFEDETQKRHTLSFDIPKVDENGRMKINGNLKILKKQLILKPIVKLGPDSVWITSQFNKVLLSRKGTTVNRATHILKQLIVDSLQNNIHVKIRYGNASNHNKNILTTVEYDDMASRFVGITVFPNSDKNKVEIIFSQVELREKIEKLNLKYEFSDTILPIGIDYRTNEVIDINIRNKKSSVSALILDKIVSTNVIPDLDKEIARLKVPKKRTYTDICLQSRSVPLIVFLGALFGLSNVINKYGTKVQLTEKPILKDRRPFIRFKDLYLYYEDYPVENALLLNGLTKVNTEEHNLTEYDDSAPYLEFLYKEFKTTNIYKGWTSFKELFLDPITLEILRDLSLPTDFMEVFLYANDLLGDNHFYHETDLRNYRVRGYEMVNEYLYKALSTQYIVLKQMKNPAKLQFSVPNDVVINKLYKSPLLAGCDITNPLNELKEKSIVSYKGTSGVNLQEAFKMDKRAYSTNAMGVIGLASVDNAMVGITKELTMDCNIINTRGYIDPINNPKEAKNLPYSKMCTVEESFFPYMMLVDDPNRIGFACNQTIHTEECDGAAIGLVGTGTEKVVAYKCPSTFAAKAKADGKVVSIDEKQNSILIEYKDGSREVVKYGLKLNRNSNFYLENNLKCAVKVGQSLKEGDILTYNPNFFEYEGKDIYLKMGTIANVAVFDGAYTDDDSTLVTEELSQRMGTNVAMRKQISLSKSCNLIKYCKIGDHVEIGDPLMVFEDTFDDSSSMILEQLGSLSDDEKAELLYKTPKANSTGTIVDIEVRWTVPLEELRPSLRDFVMEYQRRIGKMVKMEKDFTGKISKDSYNLDISKPNKDRIEGALVPENGGVIVSYFISHKKNLSVGDKISINSSLKSVIAIVTPKETSPYRENGPVDIITSYIGICKRQINSVYYYGGIGKILYDYGKRISAKYLAKQKK